MSAMYLFLYGLKLLYIDNCLYIAVKMFANNNFVIWKEISLQI